MPRSVFRNIEIIERKSRNFDFTLFEFDEFDLCQLETLPAYLRPVLCAALKQDEAAEAMRQIQELVEGTGLPAFLTLLDCMHYVVVPQEMLKEGGDSATVVLRHEPKSPVKPSQSRNKGPGAIFGRAPK